MVQELGLKDAQFLPTEEMRLVFVDLTSQFGGVARCAFLDVASNLFLTVGAPIGSVFRCDADLPQDSFPDETIGARMRVLVPANFWKIGSHITYRCSVCGVEALSGPYKPPPALGIYGLPPGWELVQGAVEGEEQPLQCSACQSLPFF